MSIHTREYNLSNSPTWLLRLARLVFPRDPLIHLILLRRKILAGARSRQNMVKLRHLREEVTEIARQE